MDCMVHGIAKSPTRLSKVDLHFHFHSSRLPNRAVKMIPVRPVRSCHSSMQSPLVAFVSHTDVLIIALTPVGSGNTVSLPIPILSSPSTLPSLVLLQLHCAATPCGMFSPQEPSACFHLGLLRVFARGSVCPYFSPLLQRQGTHEAFSTHHVKISRFFPLSQSSLPFPLTLLFSRSFTIL